MKKLSKSKLFIGTEYYFPEVSASSGYYLTGIAEYLSNTYTVKVITASQNYCDGKFIKKESINNVEVKRILGSGFNKNNLLIRGLKFIFLSLEFLFSFLQIKRNDKLLVVTNPAPIILIATILKKFINFKFFIIVHDIFPENLVAMGILTQESLIYKLLLKIFNWSYINADKIFVLGSDMKEVINKKINIFDDNKIVLIPNYTDISSIETFGKEKNEIVKSLNIENNLIFCYAGNIGRAQGIENLLQGILKLKEQNSVKFLFFGTGAYLDKVKFAETESEIIQYIGNFPREERNKFLTVCDVAIISLASGFEGLGVPSKTYDILASSRPLLVISNKNSEIAKLVIEYDLGWVCEPNNLESFGLTIKTIFDEYDLIKEKGQRAREVAETIYSKDKVLNKYLEHIL